MKILLYILFLSIAINALDLGKITTIQNDKYMQYLAKDIQSILSKYNIASDLEEINNSYDCLKSLQENKNFFSIVPKDTILYYNDISYKETNTSILMQLKVILSLGIQQIHIFAQENNNFDFENQKKFKIYCGNANSNACITARNIQSAYGWDVRYIQSDDKNITKILNNKTRRWVS